MLRTTPRPELLLQLVGQTSAPAERASKSPMLDRVYSSLERTRKSVGVPKLPAIAQAMAIRAASDDVLIVVPGSRPKKLATHIGGEENRRYREDVHSRTPETAAGKMPTDRRSPVTIATEVASVIWTQV